MCVAVCVRVCVCVCGYTRTADLPQNASSIASDMTLVVSYVWSATVVSRTACNGSTNSRENSDLEARSVFGFIDRPDF